MKYLTNLKQVRSLVTFSMNSLSLMRFESGMYHYSQIEMEVRRRMNRSAFMLVGIYNLIESN